MELTVLAHVVIILLALGLLLSALYQIPGLPEPIKKAAIVIVLVVAALYILRHYS